MKDYRPLLMLRHKAFNECRERLFLPKVAVHHQGRGKGCVL